MANTREVKLFEKEFEKTLNLSKISKLDVNFIGDYDSSKFVCDDFNSSIFSNKSIYEKNLDSLLYFNIASNTELKISGCGILYLKILKNVDLELNFEDLNFSNVVVKILVTTGKKLNLIDYSNSKNLYKNVEIILENSSILNTSQFILNSKINFTLVKLFENAVYELKSVYLGDNNSNYILNKAIHLGINSKSNLLINGVGKKNCKIINDANVVIENIAKNSKSFQKMYNLLLDSNSQIQSEPILEVKNNDVECSHASSISQISDDVLFYLTSRGISKENSIQLIVDSFFGGVIESILNPPLKIKYSSKLNI